jgi:outer membrane protein OmpA-like peptidoglycan-associated protein/Mg-chelatase subunit ChlD
MRRSTLHAIILTLSFPLLAGCSSFKMAGSGGEPAVAEDRPAPAGYQPVYLRKVAPIASLATAPSVTIGRISSDPGHTRVYVHVIDSTGTYLSGASSGKWKSIWCGLTETFNSRTRPIRNFTLREVTESDREPHAIALVMDHSGSMGEERALAVQNAADILIDRKKSDDAMALVKYDDHIGVEAPLTKDAAELHSKLRKNGLVGYGNLTAILDGIVAGMGQVAGVKNIRQKAVIVFTDGEDNSSTVNRDSVIALARRSNTIICAIDFGYGVNEEFLRGIAESTGGIYHRMYSTGEFDEVFEDIYRRLHNYYVLEYSPEEYGTHVVSVKLCLPKDTLAVEGTYDNTPQIGTTALLDVNFDINKWDITPASMPAIDNVLALMKAYPDMVIEVRGHTDSQNSTGDPDYNQKLSQRRAESVRSALTARGIASSRVRAAGFGDRLPIADNGTEEGRSQNRRTEFIIVSR